MRVIGVKKDRRLRVKTHDRIKNREIEAENRFVREFRQPVVRKDYHTFFEPSDRRRIYKVDEVTFAPNFHFCLLSIDNLAKRWCAVIQLKQPVI